MTIGPSARLLTGAVGRQMHDEQAQGHVHLRAGQADAARVQHGLDHVRGQAADLGVGRVGHGLGTGKQDGVAHAGDLQYGHAVRAFPLFDRAVMKG